MKYIRSEKYNTPALQKKMMGPNPVKLEEELLLNHRIPEKAVVCDLGSGEGLTSVFLAKEYGFTVYAADLWSDPRENRKFFDAMGLKQEQIIPVKADASDLPFEKDFFDAVVSVDSYNYFGRDERYLDGKLLPFVKSGGFIYIAIPGMKKDCHDHLPQELLLSWTRWTICTIRNTGAGRWASAREQRFFPSRKWRATRRSGPTGSSRKMNTLWAIGSPWRQAAETI